MKSTNSSGDPPVGFPGLLVISKERDQSTSHRDIPDLHRDLGLRAKGLSESQKAMGNPVGNPLQVVGPPATIA